MHLDQALEETIAGRSVDLSAIQPPLDSVSFLRALAARFEHETESARREQIAALVGQSAPTGHPLADRETIGHLLAGSRSLDDRGARRAMDVLLRCPPQLLASLPEELLRGLPPVPSENWLLLLARAKAPGTLERLLDLAARQPRWAKQEAWKIAMAANGGDAQESAILESFLRTEDPSLKSDLAKTLRLVGTRKAFAALAQEMRTPLVYRLGRVFQYPVREHIGMELVLAFPEIGPTTDINTEAGYERIEAFCHKEFGTTWKTRRPPLEYSGPLEEGFQPLP